MKTIQIMAAAAFALLLGACAEKKGSEIILFPETAFQKEVNGAGKQVSLYTLTNQNGMTCQLTNYGARLVSLWVPDKNGQFADVILGFESLDGYLNEKEDFYGSIVGRYGNRIGKGKLVIDSLEYQLSLNDGNNQLHGGAGGFYTKVWDASGVQTNENGEQFIRLNYLSPDGEEGYPGNLDLNVTYTLTNDNSLRIDYQATTDAPTVINPTNHAHFNLAGKGTVLDHQLMIAADGFTPTDSELIPTGQIAPVEGTPMDFRTPTTIGSRIDQDFEALQLGHGYDHNYVLNRQSEADIELVASLYEPTSGRLMEVLTTEPGIQVYSGNFFDGSVIGKHGVQHDYRGSVALETQHFPDSPNQPTFPSTLLRPGETYTQTTIYRFSTK